MATLGVVLPQIDPICPKSVREFWEVIVSRTLRLAEKGFFGFLLISIDILAEIDYQHVHDLFFFLARIKCASIPNSVPPGFRNISFEFLDVCSKVRFLLELWVDVFFQFLSNECDTLVREFLKLTIELVCFKYPVLTQQTAPCVLSCLVGLF